jgi:hypothetical protein
MRTLTLENLEIALRHGFVDTAKELGLTAKLLRDRIDTHNYAEDDARTDRINAKLK